MLKVMTLLGTRPELIKMSCVIREFDKYTNHNTIYLRNSIEVSNKLKQKNTQLNQ